MFNLGKLITCDGLLSAINLSNQCLDLQNMEEKSWMGTEYSVTNLLIKRGNIGDLTIANDVLVHSFFAQLQVLIRGGFIFSYN